MIPQHINLTQVSAEEYRQLYEAIEGFHGTGIKDLGLEPCNIENELDKVGAKGILNQL